MSGLAAHTQTMSAPDTIIMAFALFACLGLWLGLVMRAARHPYNDRPPVPGMWTGLTQGEEVDAVSRQETPREDIAAQAGAHAAQAASGSGAAGPVAPGRPREPAVSSRGSHGATGASSPERSKEPGRQEGSPLAL